MKKKLKILLPVLLLVLGGTYKFVLAKPAPPPKPKIEGEVYVLPKDFLINLHGPSFAKLGVALIMEPGAHVAPAGGGHGAAASPPPEGYGILPQEAVVRAIVTDVLTDQKPRKLESEAGRKALQEKILHRLHEETDVHAEEILFTDVAVQ